MAMAYLSDKNKAKEAEKEMVSLEGGQRMQSLAE